MANEWTTEYPKEPGYYWLRRGKLKRWPASISKPLIVEVDKELCFYPTGSSLPYFRSDVAYAEWFGPIQPPDDKAVASEQDVLSSVAVPANSLNVGDIISLMPPQPEPVVCARCGRYDCEPEGEGK